jgi:hypothetical protein
MSVRGAIVFGARAGEARRDDNRIVLRIAAHAPARRGT